MKRDDIRRQVVERGLRIAVATYDPSHVYLAFAGTAWYCTPHSVTNCGPTEAFVSQVQAGNVRAKLVASC